MGTWGSGNFESDDALGILEEVAGVIQPEIEGFMRSDRVGYEDLDAIIACIAIENSLIHNCNLQPRASSNAVDLKNKVLAIFDEEATGMVSDQEFVRRRREEIVATLETMVAVTNVVAEV